MDNQEKRKSADKKAKTNEQEKGDRIKRNGIRNKQGRRASSLF